MKIAFRANASIILGTGHIMRCMTLANNLQLKGAEIFFVCSQILPNLDETLGKNNIILKKINLPEHASVLEDAQATLNALKESGPFDWIIVDHYNLDARWESKLRQITQHIMVIDDLANRKHDCDLLLDQNFLPGTHQRYDHLVPPNCTVLLGPKYALVQEQFFNHARSKRHRNGEVRRLLVCVGGTDPGNETRKILDALQHLNQKIKTDVVIGCNHPHILQLKSLCQTIPNCELHIQTTQMAELMANADLAIGAGGITQWERCTMSLPSIVLGIADNQRKIIVELARNGHIIGLPNAKNITPQAIHAILETLIVTPWLVQHLAKSAASLTDGNGVRRIANRLIPHALTLRHATLQDAETLLNWRNHPLVRNASTNPNPITPKEHEKWLHSTLHNPLKKILLAEVNGTPTGTIRYDIDSKQKTAAISIYLSPEQTGQGLGSRLMDQGERWLRKNHPKITKITAFVRPDNTTSNAMFLNHGFIPQMIHLEKRIKSDHEKYPD